MRKHALLAATQSRSFSFTLPRLTPETHTMLDRFMFGRSVSGAVRGTMHDLIAYAEVGCGLIGDVGRGRVVCVEADEGMRRAAMTVKRVSS